MNKKCEILRTSFLFQLINFELFLKIFYLTILSSHMILFNLLNSHVRVLIYKLTLNFILFFFMFLKRIKLQQNKTCEMMKIFLDVKENLICSLGATYNLIRPHYLHTIYLSLQNVDQCHTAANFIFNACCNTRHARFWFSQNRGSKSLTNFYL